MEKVDNLLQVKSLRCSIRSALTLVFLNSYKHYATYRFQFNLSTEITKYLKIKLN